MIQSDEGFLWHRYNVKGEHNRLVFAAGRLETIYGCAEGRRFFKHYTTQASLHRGPQLGS